MLHYVIHTLQCILLSSYFGLSNEQTILKAQNKDDGDADHYVTVINSEQLPSNVLAVVVPNDNAPELLNNNFRNNFDAGDTLKDINKKNINEVKSIKLNKDHKILRNLWKSCSKTGIKLCKKACKKAFDVTCADQKCKKKLMKYFKNSCKTQCKIGFKAK
ncbi:hypothetical protein ACJJTC_011391 [Scirpophaga incertulas]